MKEPLDETIKRMLEEAEGADGPTGLPANPGDRQPIAKLDAIADDVKLSPGSITAIVLPDHEIVVHDLYGVWCRGFARKRGVRIYSAAQLSDDEKKEAKEGIYYIVYSGCNALDKDDRSSVFREFPLKTLMEIAISGSVASGVIGFAASMYTFLSPSEPPIISISISLAIGAAISGAAYPGICYAGSRLKQRRIIHNRDTKFYVCERINDPKYALSLIEMEADNAKNTTLQIEYENIGKRHRTPKV